MVQTLVEGLRDDPELEIRHVDVRLSDGAADIGRARPGKLLALLRACARARRLRPHDGRCALYYVPAPGDRTPLLRDLLALAWLRPAFGPLVLHWHAVGLGTWLRECATAPERALGRRLLGRADLALVLAPEVQDDADYFAPRRRLVVPNGVRDPGPPPPRRERSPGEPCEVLFLGLCSRDKGLFDTLDAIERVEREAPGSLHLAIAGAFATREEEGAVRARLAALPAGVATYHGFADAAKKRELFARADVFCFPSAYPREGQPLTIMEALAADVPIVTTRWRGIPSLLPSEHTWLVPPHDPAALARALLAAGRNPAPDGALRRHYLAHFTPERHLATLRAALLSVARE